MVSIGCLLNRKRLIGKPFALPIACKPCILIIMAYPIGDGQDSPGKPPEDSCAVAAIILAERLLKIGFICIIIRLIIEKAVAVCRIECCRELECQPGDIIEYRPEPKPEK